MDNLAYEITQSAKSIALAQSIRKRVFTDEQQIPSLLDIDGKDTFSWHLLVSYKREAIATARLTLQKNRSGVLSRIAVLPEYRGKKIGISMIQQLEKFAATKGLRKLALSPHAHLENFYRRMGYKKLKELEAVGEHPLILMEKVLEVV